MEDQLVFPLITFIREQRHEFLNFLQVILGYCQMGKYERIESYVRELQQELSMDSALFRLDSDELILLLLKIRIKFLDKGIKIIYNFDIKDMKLLLENKESIFKELERKIEFLIEGKNINGPINIKLVQSGDNLEIKCI